MDILEMSGGFLIGIIGLGVMIFVHELGHLLAAKALKVKVETFSIGYGKKLVGFKRGDTTYQIALIPFGGFTKFRGEHLFAKAIEENLDRVPHDSDSYYNEAPWKRILISLAGPFANLVFALLFFSLINWAGYTEYTFGNRIILASELEALSSGAPATAFPADAAGLESGDRILSIEGKTITTFRDISAALGMNPDKKMELTVRKADGRTVSIVITPRLNQESGAAIIGVSYDAEAVVMEIDGPTARYNPWLAPGDRLIRASGQAVETRLDFIRLLRGKPNFIPLSIDRGGKKIDGFFFPHYGNRNMTAGLDFEASLFPSPVYTLPQAVGKGLEDMGAAFQSFLYLFRIIGKMNAANVANSVIGPVKTSYLIGVSTIHGFNTGFWQGLSIFFRMLCLISVILAIMNLLPLPVLDGGFIVLWLVEWVRRRPFRPRFLYYFQVIGFFFIVILGAFVLIKDFFPPMR